VINKSFVNRERWYRSIYFQEIIVFAAMFILTTIHEWLELNSFLQFIKGLAFFLILYFHAQFHRFFTFPLLLNKRYAAYISVTTLSLVICTLVLYAANFYWIDPEWLREDNHFWKHLIYFLVICMTSTITILVLSVTRQYYAALQKRSQDKILLNDMNIKLLHAQINPHFVFNMFNNLYAVSLTDPSRVSELILKLSKLIRYQLETGVQSAVSVYDEVEFIKNYITMEKERIGKRCEISFSYPDDEMALKRFQLSPLILINLVENAFKHSITVQEKWYVNIQIEVIKDRLKLVIKNSIAGESLRSKSTGIGLSNIRERLALLYHDDHVFEAGAWEDEFIAFLDIPLKKAI